LYEGEKVNMNLKRSFRTFVMLLLAGLLVFGLAACRLPASRGPSTAGSPEGEFPVPGESEQAPVATEESAFPTSTPQAYPQPEVPTQALPTQNPPQIATKPVATEAASASTPTATPITYVQPTPGGPPQTYTLQEGEYPFCIARRFNVNQTELLELNGITADSFFYAGQALKIPQTGNPFDGLRVLHDHPTTYKILQDDTLYKIACYFGDLSPDLIALQNNLSTWDLPVGEVLIIP
jgi:LysM repeat protein